MWQKRHLALTRPCPSDGSFRGCKEQQRGCTTQARRAPPRKGDQPKVWRATVPKTSGHQPKDWAGRGLFFNTVGTHVSILDFGGFVSEVVRGSGICVGALVGSLYWSP